MKAELLGITAIKVLINPSYNVNGMKFSLQKVVEELKWKEISPEKKFNI